MKRLDRERLCANVERAAQYDFEQKKVFGSAYCVMQEDEILYRKCFGVTSPGGVDPVTGQTLFRLASMTKPVTAVAVLILAERGKLSLADRVSDYLPEYKNVSITRLEAGKGRIELGKAKTPLTVFQLLTHTSGIGDNGEKMMRMSDEDKISVDRTARYFAEAGLDFEPGTKQQYSPIGAFDVLAKIIEITSETDFAQLLQKEIFEPCQMINTGFVPEKACRSGIISMHQRQDGENAVAKMKEGCVFGDIPCTHYLGGAGLVSTLDDYVRFAKMLLDGGKCFGKRILLEDSVRLIRTPHFPKDGTNQAWGLGVRVIAKEAYPRLPVGAFGWSGAYGAHFWIDPVNRIAAVMMKNSLFDGGAGNESSRNFEQAVNDSFFSDEIGP